MKSAKVSMFIFILHFAKINAKMNINEIFIPMFKGFFFIGLWTIPLIINYDMRYSTKFNVYYIFLSFIIGLLTLVVKGVSDDMNHAVYLHKEKYKLSAYYRLLVKLYNIF